MRPAGGGAPHDTVWLLANGWVAARCLQLVAELGVADLLGDEPARAADLAAGCGADPDALDRVLRLLTAYEVFRRDGAGYAHTEASRLLRSDHPRSMRALGRMHGTAPFTGCHVEFGRSVRTGRPAAEALGPGGLFGLLSQDPAAARIFDEAMTAKARADVAAVVAAVDFASFGTVADVGGGRGHLVRAILEANPGLTGVLFDLPGVLGTLDDVPPRLRLHPGSFFDDPLPEAGAYVLMDVLHDWTDEECARILAAVRAAAPPGAAVLVVENLLAEDEVDLRGWTLDVLMLAVTGGRERTPAQLGALLAGAGFVYDGVTATPGRMRIVRGSAR